VRFGDRIPAIHEISRNCDPATQIRMVNFHARVDLRHADISAGRELMNFG